MEILKEQYEKEVVPALMKKFNYKSVMEVPKLDKIVINIGLGDIKENPKELENAISELTQITGQEARRQESTAEDICRQQRKLFPGEISARKDDLQRWQYKGKRHSDHAEKHYGISQTRRGKDNLYLHHLTRAEDPYLRHPDEPATAGRQSCGRAQPRTKGTLRQHP